MSEDKKNHILSRFEDRLSQTVAEILSLSAESSLLSTILNRSVGPEKSPRDYSLMSFSSLYSMALPFMQAGSSSFRKGEAIFLYEFLADLAGRRSGIKELLAAIDSKPSEQFYPYNQKIEAERMANIFLKTSGSDTYESVYLELLNSLVEKNAISKADFETLQMALAKTDELVFSRQIETLNPLPGMTSKKPWRASSGLPEPLSVKNIISYPVNILDHRNGTLELLTPVIKDLLERDRAGKLEQDSIGLGALSPVMEQLENEGYLGIVFKIEFGAIKKLSLIKLPKDEIMPPQYGPLRAMICTLLNEVGPISEKLEDLDINEFITSTKDGSVFFAITTAGAVSSPKEANLVLEGEIAITKRADNEVIAAVETFVLSPSRKQALLLDPVAVNYSSIDDEVNVFETTRLCFYSLKPEAMSPHHQGALTLGVDTESYESACLNGATVAEEILNESFSFLTGEYGKDELAETVEQAIELIKIKYGSAQAFRYLGKGEGVSHLCEAVSGKFGPNGGMSAEIYSLAYQQSFNENPILFAACIHTAHFLSDLKTYPQRFDINKYLNSAS